ncbi:MAG TPA: FAD-binding protein, partial [Propionibacteriaceae bacterium]|nr:FAD-binding protein [Propionibacteriaceae bacterium]
MATRTIGGIEALKAAMTGAFVRPDDLDHEQVRNVWMAAMINHHPAVIVRCATAQDAAQAIRFAQNQGLELVVRSGAHSAPGLRDLDAATQRYGLAVPAGLVSHTGVADLTVGGGMGWLIRQAGLSIDNLVSAEVVVADGKILRATEDDNPHLFWAIRGGGGNFGVVTELEFRLHDVDPVVQFGLLFWDAREGEQALRLMRDTIADLPRTL